MNEKLRDFRESVARKRIDRGYRPLHVPVPIKGEPGRDGKDGRDGMPGRDGKDADEKKITSIVLNKVLAKIPEPQQIDEDSLFERLVQRISQHQGMLGSIQEKIEIDPMDVIEKIMSLPKGKFKLKTEHIDGLEQTIAAFHSQLGRGYLHGGGDTVAAGSNVTITTNAQGQKVISAGASSTITTEKFATSGGVQTITLAHTPTAIILVVLNGQVLTETTDYTVAGSNITLLNPDIPAGLSVLVTYTY